MVRISLLGVWGGDVCLCGVAFNLGTGVMSRTHSVDYEFKYLCDSHEIDLTTFAYSQIYYTHILKALQEDLMPSSKVSIKVRAITPGSFNITHLVEISAIVGMLVFDKTLPIKKLFEYFRAYFDVHRILSDKKVLSEEKQGETTVVKTGDGSHTFNSCVFNFYKTREDVDTATRQLSEITLGNDKIEGIKISEVKTKNEVFSMSREEFSKHLLPNPYFQMSNDDEEQLKEEEFECLLYLSKVDFEPQSTPKWDFVLNETKIRGVGVLDTLFLERVKQGLRFGRGDALRAIVRKISLKERSTGLLRIKKLEVLRVLEVLVRQRDLPFTGD